MIGAIKVKSGVKRGKNRAKSLVLVGYRINKALRSAGLPPVLCYYLQRSLQLGLVLATNQYLGSAALGYKRLVDWLEVRPHGSLAFHMTIGTLRNPECSTWRLEV